MPVPEKGLALLPELQGLPAIERARFVARQRCAGMRMEQIGQLLGVSPQRCGQLVKKYAYDAEIQALRDIGSAVAMHRKGVAALAELVDLGLGIAREAAADPEVERKEKAAIVAAAVGPAHRLVEGSEKVLKRHQVGPTGQAKAVFDHHQLLDSIAIALEKIKTLPSEAQPAAREAMRATIHGTKPESPVIDVAAIAAPAGPESLDEAIMPF